MKMTRYFGPNADATDITGGAVDGVGYTVFAATNGWNLYAFAPDGEKRWEKKEVTGQDRETFLRVDLKGAKKMRLLVDFGKKLHILDRAVWADAFLIKKTEECGR